MLKYLLLSYFGLASTIFLYCVFVLAINAYKYRKYGLPSINHPLKRLKLFDEFFFDYYGDYYGEEGELGGKALILIICSVGWGLVVLGVGAWKLFNWIVKKFFISMEEKVQIALGTIKKNTK